MAENNIALSTYTSFSGADLLVTFGNKVIGELQQISYAIQREKVPVFTLGSPNPRSFSRGKRGIAGSLVIAQFDKDVLLDTMREQMKQILGGQKMFTAAGNQIIRAGNDFSTAIKSSYGFQNKQSIKDMQIKAAAQSAYANAYNLKMISINPNGDVPSNDMIKQSITAGEAARVAYLQANPITTADSTSGGVSLQHDDNALKATFSGDPTGFINMADNFSNISYADQLPPFDVTLTFANEYGQSAYMKIYDLELLNEASGVSVDSVVMEKNYTWIARAISPLYKGVTK